MYNYMKSLYHQFDTLSHQVKQLEKMVNAAHKQLSGQLDKPERKLLLRLVDLEDTLRYHACLNSFVSGFRLANGIHQELAQKRPYSFADEEENLICELTNRKEG